MARDKKVSNSRESNDTSKSTAVQMAVKAVIMLVVGGAVAWAVLTRFSATVKRDPADYEDSRQQLTEVESIAGMNLDNSYPGTPEKVVALYARIIKASYGEEYTAEQGEELFSKLYELFDEELQSNQGSHEEFLKKMKADAKSKKDAGIVVANYFPGETSATEYYEVKGRTIASLNCRIVMRKGAKADTYLYKFTMRQDNGSGKKWKILGWEVSDEDDTDAASTVEALSSMNIDTDYPRNPHDVVDLFAKVTTTLYNEEYSDEAFRAMGKVRAALYDDELLGNQTDLESQLRQEVSSKKDANITVSAYVLDEADKFVYKTLGADECSEGSCMFSMLASGGDSKRQIINYDFVLIKDAKGRWKIHGWEIKEKK